MCRFSVSRADKPSSAGRRLERFDLGLLGFSEQKDFESEQANELTYNDTLSGLNESTNFDASSWLTATPAIEPSQLASPATDPFAFSGGLQAIGEDSDFFDLGEDHDGLLEQLLKNEDFTIPEPPSAVNLACANAPSTSLPEGGLLSTMMKHTHDHHLPITAVSQQPIMQQMVHPAVHQARGVFPAMPGLELGAVALQQMQAQIAANMQLLHSRMAVNAEDRMYHSKSVETDSDMTDSIERIKKKRRESAQRSRARKSAYIKSLEHENKVLKDENRKLKEAMARHKDCGMRSDSPSMSASASASHSKQPSSDMSSFLSSYGLDIRMHSNPAEYAFLLQQMRT